MSICKFCNKFAQTIHLSNEIVHKLYNNYENSDE